MVRLFLRLTYKIALLSYIYFCYLLELFRLPPLPLRCCCCCLVLPENTGIYGLGDLFGPLRLLIYLFIIAAAAARGTYQ